MNAQGKTVRVVGAGVGGLLTAALLRARGVDAVVVERASKAGGRARSPLLGGLPVNLGPRALYNGGPFEAALRSLGVRPRGFSPKPKGTFGILDGDVVAIPTSLGDLLASPLLSSAEKRAFAMAFARLAVGALDIEKDERIDAWLTRHLPDGRARSLMHMLVRVATYSDDGAHDAKLALMQTRRALTKGVLYIDGGWQTLVDALAERAGPIANADVNADVVVDASQPESPASPITASCLDLVLDRLPRPDRLVALGVDRPLYFSVHKKAAAPFIAHAMINGSASRAELESIVDVVQPGWRDAVVEARYLSRMVVSSQLPRAGVARGPSRVDERTYRVGDAVDAGYLLADNVAASAMNVVDAIVSTRASERAA